jgi:hypothetical protein
MVCLLKNAQEFLSRGHLRFIGPFPNTEEEGAEKDIANGLGEEGNRCGVAGHQAQEVLTIQRVSGPAEEIGNEPEAQGRADGESQDAAPFKSVSNDGSQDRTKSNTKVHTECWGFRKIGET